MTKTSAYCGRSTTVQSTGDGRTHTTGPRRNEREKRKSEFRYAHVTYPSSEEVIEQKTTQDERAVRLTQRLGRVLQCCGLSTVPSSVGHELLNQRWITWRRAARVYNGLAHTCKQMADGINQDGETSILHGPPLSIFTQ